MLWTMSMWTALLVDFMSPTPLQSKSLNVSMTFLGLSWITSICNSINVQPLHVFIFKPNWSPKQRQPIKRPYAIHAAFMVFFKQLVNVFAAYCKSNCQQIGPPPLIGGFSTLQFSWPFPQRLCMKSKSSSIKDVKAVMRKSFCPSLWMPHSFVFWPPHLQVTRGWSYLENGVSGSIFSKQATGLRGVKSWHGQKSDSNDLRCQDDSFTSKSPILALMYRFTQPEKHAS